MRNDIAKLKRGGKNTFYLLPIPFYFSKMEGDK